MRRKLSFVLIAALAAAAAGYYVLHSRPSALILTGVVTTDDVIVSPQIGGRIAQLLVNEGDTVKGDQLLAVITPDELKEERAYYAFSAAGVGSQVKESEAALRYQERQTIDQVHQAE